MNSENRCCRTGGICAWIVGLAGVFLIGWGLVSLLNHYTTPAPAGVARGEERLKFQTETRTASAEQLGSYGFVDASKGQVRLTVEHAMQLTIQEWKDSSAGHAKLVERWKKMNPPPPPPAPPKPSEFE